MAALATVVDFVHALLIAAWVVGLPLLFWHRWPRVSRGFAVYAVGFVVLNLLSGWLLGECFLTTITRFLWTHAPTHPRDANEWFTVRFADFVFGLSPSHRSIRLLSKVLIFASAAGVLSFGLRRREREPVGPHRHRHA
jgi:hypothetical protein